MFPQLSCSKIVIPKDSGSTLRDESPRSSNDMEESKSCGLLPNNSSNIGSGQRDEDVLSSSVRNLSESHGFLSDNREALRIPENFRKDPISHQHRGRNMERENNLNRMKTEPKPEESKASIKAISIPFQGDNTSPLENKGDDPPECEETSNKYQKPSGFSRVNSPLEENRETYLEYEGNNLDRKKNLKEMNFSNKTKSVFPRINPASPGQKIDLNKNNANNNKLTENSSEIVKQVINKRHKFPEIKFDGTSEFVELPYSKTRVPMIFKRMVHVKHLPVDPMLKYHKQKFQFSLGFKTTERTDSVKTICDDELDRQHRLWCQLEAMTGEFGMKFPKLIIEDTLFPILTREDLKKKEEESYEWYGDGGIIHDAIERLWNWKASMINSNLLRDKDGRPLFNPDLDIRQMSQLPDFEQGSLSPDEYDEQLRKLFINSSLGVSATSDVSSDSSLEYDEIKFLQSNFCHPLSSNRFNQYRLKKLLEHEGTLSNANRISQTDSQILDLMYREAQSMKPKKKKIDEEVKKTSEDKEATHSEGKTSSGTNSSQSAADDEVNSDGESNHNNVNYSAQPYEGKPESSSRTRFFRRSSSTIEKEEEKWRYYWRKSLRGGSSAEESRRIYREILQELEEEFEEVEEEEEFQTPDEPLHRSSSADAVVESKRVRKKTKDIRTRFIKAWMNEIDQIVYDVQKDLYDDSFRRMIDKCIQTRPPTPYWVRVGKTKKPFQKKASVDGSPTSDKSVEPFLQPEMPNESIKSPSSTLSNQEEEEQWQEENETIIPSLTLQSEQKEDRNSQDEKEELISPESQELEEEVEEEAWSLQVHIEGKTAVKSQRPKRSMKDQRNLLNQDGDESSQDGINEGDLDLLELSEEEEMEDTFSVDSELLEEDYYEDSVYDLDLTALGEKSLPLETEGTKVSFDEMNTKSAPTELSPMEDMTLSTKVKTELTDSIPFKMSKVGEDLQDKTGTITKDLSAFPKRMRLTKSSREPPEKSSTHSLLTPTKSLTSSEAVPKNLDGEYPDKPRAKFHFAPDVVIGSAKPRPKRRNRYRKPMSLLQIKIAEGEEHKKQRSKADKGVQTLKYIPIWKRSASHLLKASDYVPLAKEVKRIIKPSELTPEMINEEDRLIESIYGIPSPPSPPPFSIGEKINDMESQKRKETTEVDEMPYERYDEKYRQELDKITRKIHDDSILPVGAEADTVDSEPEEKTGQGKFNQLNLDAQNKVHPTLQRSKHRSSTTYQISPPESSLQMRKPKLYEEMIEFFENMTPWEKILFDFSYKGWEYAGYDWQKIKEVVYDRDGQYWGAMYDNIREDEYFAQFQKQHIINDFMPKAKDRGKFGLEKRCASLVDGTKNLYRGLFRADPKMTSIEMVLDAMFKDRLFGLPLSLKDTDEMRHYYTNIIVRDPKLYRAIMKNRDCLQHDLLVMVHGVLKGLNITDNALADRYPCRQQSRLIQLEANKKYASVISSERGEKTPLNAFIKIGEKRPHEIFFEKHFNEAGSDFRYPPAQQLIIDAAMAVDMDKEAKIKVYNPATNIIEDARYLNKDFATYAYPLFESNWRDIGYDRRVEIMLPELKELRDLRQSRFDKMKANKTITRADNEEYSLKTKRLCKELVDRVYKMLKKSRERNRHNGVWKCLLACIHGITFWLEIEDNLVENFKEWIPMLLLGLRIDNKLVRQEVCYTIALLVSNYRFISKLHKESKNRLISNVTFAVLDAMEEYPESYLFYYGVIAYLLHSVPCNATLLALLTWIPEIVERGDESALAKDWPLFIYYVAKHWPQSAIRWRYSHEEKFLEMLECALLRPISKRNAQLALKYVCRREECIPKLFTVWRGRKIGEHVRIIDRQIFDGSTTYDI